MNKEKFKKIGLKWNILNKRYDDYIKKIIDEPKSYELLNKENVKDLEYMQKELYNLETQLFEMIKE